VGCTAHAHERARWFGDDLALYADSYAVDLTGLPALAFMLKHAGAGSPPLERIRKKGMLLATGKQMMAEGASSHCEAASLLAKRLGLGPDVPAPLAQAFERWDGKGEPAGIVARSWRSRSGSCS
jgi:hypothetical protein